MNPRLSPIWSIFSIPPPPAWQWAQDETWDKAHGRLEHRRITCTSELNEWFAKRWIGVAQVFRLERTTLLLKSQKVHQEVVYGISNLSMSQASPGRMLALNRNHWGIESRLHWRRDVTLGEDRCQTRTGTAPAILACLNSAILSLMDRLGVHNVPGKHAFSMPMSLKLARLFSLDIVQFFRIGMPWHQCDSSQAIKKPSVAAIFNWITMLPLLVLNTSMAEGVSST